MSEGNDKGGHPTPSEKAWETARERAREQGQSVREDELRCIKSNGLSCWAKLLFWILSKICWETSSFLHNRRVGSVCITGRQLKLYFSFPKKRLYVQTKKTKDKSGAVVSTRRVGGAIEELKNAGLVWMSQKRIENIPSNKWPNVFNLTTLVPQVQHQELGLLEGVTVVDSSGTNGGASDFLAKNGGGTGQTLQKGLGKNQWGDLAGTNGGTSQEPLVDLGKNQRGDLARTPVGSTTGPPVGSSQEPLVDLGKNHWGYLARTAGGTPLKTVRPCTDVQDSLTSTPLKRSTVLNAQKAGREKGKASNFFLLDVDAMMERWRNGSSKAELANSGAWWRLAFRTDRDLMQRVLAETLRAVKESQIKETPGQYAVDLWKRWGGKLPEASR